MGGGGTGGAYCAKANDASRKSINASENPRSFILSLFLAAKCDNENRVVRIKPSPYKTGFSAMLRKYRGASVNAVTAVTQSSDSGHSQVLGSYCFLVASMH